MDARELDVNVINMDVIHSIEEAIGIHEYVSMIFLLYDEVPSALERMSMSLNLHFNKEPISVSALLDWVKMMHSDPYWKYKFVEALVICKCMSVISYLGLNQEAVSGHFLPKSLDTSLHIHPVKKILYHMCEDFDLANSNMFIELTNQLLGIDFHKTENKISTNIASFLELFLLKIVQGKHIRLGHYSFQEPVTGTHDKCNIKLIADVCKNINVKYYKRLLETERRINGWTEHYETEKRNDGLTEQDANYEQSQLNLLKHLNIHKLENTDQSSNYDESEKYILQDVSEVGVCIIINQREFNKTGQSLNCFSAEVLPDRDGTDKDKDRLIVTWTNFRAKCYSFDNLTSTQIISNIEDVIQNKVQSYHGFIAIFILSHGIEGAVYGVDGIPLRIDRIKECISARNAPKLIDKPRMIIIQACQGLERLKNRIQFDGPSEKNIHITDVSDILIFTSSLPNFVSVRDAVCGSWFIQTLCDVLDGSNGTKHLLDLFIETIGLVAEKKHPNVDISMHPKLEILWRKKLFLRKHK